MAEYSRMAMGSFACTAQYQVVYLPFKPDYVKVVNLSGNNNSGAGSGTTLQLEWANAMNQGDGILYLKGSGTDFYPVGAVANAGAGSGVTTFSAGLDFQFGAQLVVSGITKASPAVVTTSTAHGYNPGDIVMFEGITGMQQMAGIPLQIATVPSTTTFTIANATWNVNQSNYTAVSAATARVKKVLYPFLYAPGVSFISAITLGSTTVVSTTVPHNLVVGQEVAFRIPTQWGTTQLNSLPNVLLPGSPVYGYVVTVNSTTQVTVNINSSAFTTFTSNVVYGAGLTPPQMLAVGDVNTGGWPISSGSALYPSPTVNGVRTINGPAIQGAFVNNTRQGFLLGDALLTPGAVNTTTFFWEARLHDYVDNASVGVAVS